MSLSWFSNVDGKVVSKFHVNGHAGKVTSVNATC